MQWSPWPKRIILRRQALLSCNPAQLESIFPAIDPEITLHPCELSYSPIWPCFCHQHNMTKDLGGAMLQVTTGLQTLISVIDIEVGLWPSSRPSWPQSKNPWRQDCGSRSDSTFWNSIHVLYFNLPTALQRFSSAHILYVSCYIEMWFLHL